MDESTDVLAAIKSFESALFGVGTKLAISTAAVVLGLLIEYWDDAGLASRALLRSLRNRTWSQWHLLDRHVKTTVIGGLFITLGVSAELWYEHRTRLLESELQSANEIVIASLNAKASSAEALSKQLDKDDLTLRRDLAALNTKAANANQHLAKLQTEASRARTDQQEVAIQLAVEQRNVAEANRKVEQERITRLRLQDSLAPRTLPQSSSYDGKRTSYDSLTRFAGVTALIQFAQDEEARRLALQIAQTLRMAGWTVIPPTPTSAQYFDGVIIVPGPNEATSSSDKAAIALDNFLFGCNVGSVVMRLGGFEVSQCEIHRSFGRAQAVPGTRKYTESTRRKSAESGEPHRSTVPSMGSVSSLLEVQS